MKKLVFSAVLAGTLSIGALGSAYADDGCQTAGTLTQAVGSVMVDKGKGFTPGVVGASLRVGDKIAVRGPGSAVVDFGNERTLMVPASTTETIRVPGCGLIQTQAPLDPTLGVLGMLAGTGAVAAIISASDGKSGTTIFFPVSP
ncbi:hypothetical protein [Ancylobacter sp.]|uniref:hypothetical protein n=1 Tax=Ancylobacter sp. TaxID=1872567 RepID=UPI003D0CAF27